LGILQITLLVCGLEQYNITANHDYILNQRLDLWK